MLTFAAPCGQITVVSWDQRLTLNVTPKADNTFAWRLFWDVWERLRRGMSANLRRKPCRSVLTYATIQAQEHWVSYGSSYIRDDAARGRFTYFFNDEQGNADVYCQVATHWMTLTLGLLYEEVERMFRRRGYELLTPRPDVAALARTPVKEPLFVAQKYVNQLVPWPESPSGWYMRADLSGPSEDRLTAEERAHAEAVFASRLCACDYCERLRAGSLGASPGAAS